MTARGLSAEEVLNNCIASFVRNDVENLARLVAEAELALPPGTPKDRDRCYSKARLLEALLRETDRNLKLFLSNQTATSLYRRSAHADLNGRSI